MPFPSLTSILGGLIDRIRLAGPSPSDWQGRGEYFDPRFKRVLWYLIASTRGGINRAKILGMLHSNPANANQIATEMRIDYKTAIHHLKVLSENGLIITDMMDSYGATYFLTPIMEKNYPTFQALLTKIRENKSG